MSEQDVLELLGAEVVERSDSYIGEGFCAPGTRIFPGTPAEIEIIWSDTSYSVISTASVSQASSPWRTPRGVRVGSNLKALESMLGEPIQFGGFGWDYGGGALWIEDDLRIGLRLSATPESEREVVDDARYPEILGGRSVRSDHPVVRALTILVVRIDLTGPGLSEVQYECGE